MAEGEPLSQRACAGIPVQYGQSLLAQPVQQRGDDQGSVRAGKWPLGEDDRAEPLDPPRDENTVGPSYFVLSGQ